MPRKTRLLALYLVLWGAFGLLTFTRLPVWLALPITIGPTIVLLIAVMVREHRAAKRRMAERERG